MARLDLRLDGNAAGDLYVDSTCIDCDTCRWMAPATFTEDGDHSVVARQPATEAEWADALRALVSCPTSSIGVTGDHDVAAAARSLPVEIEPGVLHCGHHAESSFGAASYLLLRDGGNVLVDSPRWNGPLAARIEELGGARWMFLTHKDDVADHARWAERLGCERVLHEGDVTRGTRDVEIRVEGDEPLRLADDLLVVPTPGHTEGSACLLHDDRVLFSGDHLAWSPSRGDLTAFRSACWYDWDVQTESMARLAEHDFEVVLPGHGRRCRFPRDEMRRRLRSLVEWMRSVR